MKICFTASECFPYVKTGGLGDVAGTLPKALAEIGNDVIIFLPLYSGIKTIEHNLNLVTDFQDIPLKIGNNEVKFNVWYGTLPESEVEVYFIDCPVYFHRDMPYTNDPDEAERFILFQRAVIETLQRLKWSPDIIHCNDWQTSLIPVYLKTIYKWDKLFEKTSVLLSVHNIGYQGRFPEKFVLSSGLPVSDYYPEGPLELDHSFCFLKAGILYSEIISTVSPTYSIEIQTKEFGAGMEGVLNTRKEDIYGILNGIDTDIWNPGTDKYIPNNYTVKKLNNKVLCKKELLKEAGIEYNSDTPSVGIISRFAGQKGFDLLFPVVRELTELNFQLLVLGSGEKETENFFRELAVRFPEKVNTFIGYNNKLAHYITAGCDIFLMPSKYEPCGLNQMYSLNYGTVPIVRKTGGLADTVKDYHEFNLEGNGFSFEDATPFAFISTLKRSLDIFSDKKAWKKIMLRGMKEDFSWKHSADLYIDLYKKAVLNHG